MGSDPEFESGPQWTPGFVLSLIAIVCATIVFVAFLVFFGWLFYCNPVIAKNIFISMVAGIVVIVLVCAFLFVFAD